MTLFKPMLAVTVALASAAGVGAYTFSYARGGSYLSDDPAACANCHVMDDHYSAWLKGSHHAVAGCNDCHTQRDSVVGKYVTKAVNGFMHSYAFTTGDFADPLRIRAYNAEVTEGACRSCHVVAETIATSAHSQLGGEGQQLSCISCHRTVGHWVR